MESRYLDLILCCLNLILVFVLTRRVLVIGMHLEEPVDRIDYHLERRRQPAVILDVAQELLAQKLLSGGEVEKV